MNTTCPNCNRPVIVFYSLHRQEAICLCSNPQCELAAGGIEGSGNTTKEAIDLFQWKALKMERPKMQTAK